MKFLDGKFLRDILSGYPPYRLRQVGEAIFKNLAESWDEITNLPRDLLEVLEATCPLTIKHEAFLDKSGQTVKFLVTLDDGLKIETVLMRHLGRNTVCVSSAVGCPLGCAFCATGMMGFKRQLMPGEIVGQVLLAARWLKNKGERVNNVVFMGMGEPFLNYENVFVAVRRINDQKGLSIGARHISISTVGIVEGILKMAEEPIQVNLALSLHAPNDALRSKIMSGTRKYKLNDVLRAISKYIQKTRRKVMLEYVLLKDVNDTKECAEELVKLVKKFGQGLCFVNLIAYNPTGQFKSSSPERIKQIKDFLMKNGVPATERWRFGDEIKGACGQLAGNNN